MNPDDQETHFRELEEINIVINLYFQENLPTLVIKRRTNIAKGSTDFIICNYIKKKSIYFGSTSHKACNAFINFSVDKIYIGVENTARELDLCNPKTPEDIYDFLNEKCTLVA